LELTGRVAIVTGAGRGIGRAIAKKFASEGAAVLLTARTKTEIDAVAEEIRKAGGRAEALVADVSSEKDCERIVDAAKTAFGRVQILVNNAGIYGPVQPVERVSPSEWDSVIAVNLRGPFLLSRLVLPGMYEQGSGAILNVVSIAAKAAFQLNSPYAASKAGLIGLTHTLAAEAARKGVRVNAVSPGSTDTPGLSDLLASSEVGQQRLKMLSNAVPLGRLGTPDEIAKAVVFLASDDASYITGTELFVDGGFAQV